jgi:hypothetical protein
MRHAVDALKIFSLISPVEFDRLLAKLGLRCTSHVQASGDWRERLALEII